MPLINLQAVTLSYGVPPLLDSVSLRVEKGERVCLLGRNGAGKSTLLKLISGDLQQDSGELWVGEGVRISRLSQDIPAEASGSVFDQVSGGLGELADWVRQYHDLGQRLGEGTDERLLARLSAVQHRLETAGGWEIERRTERLISRLRLVPDAPFSTLSGGLQRRVLLARALVSEPDLLLLDEPTNHLDIDAIEWLEGFLLEFPGAVLFVTHDRVFQRRLATRILELDRGRLTDWPGDYENYLRRREERMHAETLANVRFDRKLSEEEAWIRQGIKARRTRNQGRVRALAAMREERHRRRVQVGKARLRLREAERSGTLVVEAEGVAYSWGGEPVMQDLSTTILRGDKVGIIGPNGAGKSTLLKLLLGELPPEGGRIRQGTNLQVAYFDQLRAGLEEGKSVQDNVAGGSDQVLVEGRSKHVLSYLKDFLFTADRARQPVSALSGGERNRLLLAKLFARRANLLVMDEPTNDLDAETLELFEELLMDFKGTLLLVSHDRALLNAVVTSTLVFEGRGRVCEYAGGYDDWLRQRPAASATAETAEPKGANRSGQSPLSKGSTGKLSYKAQRELEALPARIESLETEQARLHGRLADSAFYRQEGSAISEGKGRLAAVEAQLEQAYARWEILEELKG
jgi:ATP-binding cassette subfamily F protein uup